ncbi:MAG: PIN domain-containing protein [Thermodesulfovibrionales bacterium]|nr:PIN domain-containing protein [Thermodesulfovibrionales bacterium]
MLKLVIDTNVLVASLFGGNAGRLVEAWRGHGPFYPERIIFLCVTPAVLREYENILTRFSFRGEKLKNLLNDIRDGKNILLDENPPDGRWVKDDPEDDKFIACALAHGAEIIVSSDIHLKEAAPGAGLTVCGSGKALERAGTKAG